MNRKFLAAGLSGAAMLAACSAPPPDRAPEQPQAAAPQASPLPSPPLAPAPASFIAPLTIDAYKKSVAERVASASPDIFGEPLPEMFKSIVVLDITIDREGRLANVAVRRSNGFKALEARAMDSVKRAAPFGAPAFTVRRGDGTVSFLETFLFREDGRFRIRSLEP